MTYRIAIDIGGTFTDVVVADSQGDLKVGKALSTPARAFEGISAALENAASQMEISLSHLLNLTDQILYGTTRATNAIVEGKTARTAFFTTRGFSHMLLLREGGKLEPFNYAMAYPDPYVPAHLTFEVPERIDSEGNIVVPLDEETTTKSVEKAIEKNVESIGICLLWSIVNPAHELLVGEIIERVAPGLPFTLSHKLNPIIREYRRSSSTVIDASLKPLMQAHLAEMESDLKDSGFRGSLLVATSFGGAWRVKDAIERPIYVVGSGPSVAPKAALTWGELEFSKYTTRDMIVCDAGGTTFDVSLISGGVIGQTSETWLGPRFTSHLLGISSVDVKSIGAGGGSIAWIDPAGLLHVGPQSAGADPGPVAYGFGGKLPTVTDAALVLGYLDPEYFLGGRMRLSLSEASSVLEEAIAKPLGMSTEAAASGILTIAAENMVNAIKEITINQGVDPRRANIVAGGGASGLNIVPIARELGCTSVLIPKVAGALSAFGGLFSDLITEYKISKFAESQRINLQEINVVLEGLDRFMEEYILGLSDGHNDSQKEFFVEARYPYQLYELMVPLSRSRLEGDEAVHDLVERFHEEHERVFAVREKGQRIECLTWTGRVTVSLPKPLLVESTRKQDVSPLPRVVSKCYFNGFGFVTTPRFLGNDLLPAQIIDGPAIIEEPTTTVVVYPGTKAAITSFGNYLLEIEPEFNLNSEAFK